jgi:hypothetical protein
MKDDAGRENNKVYIPICSRCDRNIEPGETMFAMYVSLLKLKSNYSVQLIEQHHLSQFCFGCASAVLTDAAITEKLVAPITCFEEINKK